MRRFVGKQNQLTDLTALDRPKASDPLISDISIDKLVDDCLLAMHREVKNILVLSAHGKLDAATARDLRDHLKLLFEMKDRENSLLKGLTDEQLKTIVDSEIPNETE